MIPSVVRGHVARHLAAEPAPVDAVAEGRALDAEQLGGPRLVAARHPQRPGDHAGFQLAQHIIECNGRGGIAVAVRAGGVHGTMAVLERAQALEHRAQARALFVVDRFGLNWH